VKPFCLTESSPKVVQASSLDQVSFVGDILSGVFLVLFLSCAIAGTLMYKKCRMNRIKTLRQQVESLERLWQTNSE
jgi:uncharacterized integral membrane protein